MDFSPRRQLSSSGPFVCTNPGCDKSFLRKEHLNRHLQTHTNSRPHKCFICGRSFARSDILNRHVLQHNVPPDGLKRTPLACQTCRRRKTKCDSNYPCSTCADLGETCVRDLSSMQAFMPTTRSRRKRLPGDEERPVDATDEDGPDEEGAGTISSTEDTSLMQQYWTALIFRSDSSSATNAHPASVSAEQDALQQLPESYISMIPGHSMHTSTSNPYSSLYVGEAPSPLNVFGLPLPQSSESGDQFSVDQLRGVQISESDSPESSTGWPQLNMAITGQVQFVTAQIKSPYFAHFHQAWPLLHVPTLILEKQATLLTSALANLSVWMQNANTEHLVPNTINKELIQGLMPPVTEESLTGKPAAEITLQPLLALVVTLIYAILGDAPISTLNWAAQWIDITISTLRRLGALDNRWLPQLQLRATEESWVLGEQMKRLVYIVLRIDAYLCIILDRPPTLRYQEIGLPLPASEGLWRAETREARTQLHWYEHAGRSRSAFSTMMRDGIETQGFMTGYLRMPHLSLEDNHFSLCSFLSELWGVCKEAYEEHHLHYRSPKINRTADRVKLWKGYLHDWLVHIQKTDELEDSFFKEGSGDYNHFLGLNLTLYHLVSLKLHANLRLLEYKKCCVHCQEGDVENLISAWSQSTDGRQAVYHAAQLKRVYERENILYKPNDQRLCNVLGPAGLLASAIVLCLYSAKVSAAEGDAVITSVKAIELGNSKLVATPEYENWIAQGGPAAMDGTPLHAFSVPRLLSWYRDQLMSSPMYSSRLVAFLLTLKI